MRAWVLAIVLFADVARADAQCESDLRDKALHGDANAALLYLESVKKDPDCIAKDIPELVRVHCTKPKRAAECDVLEKVHADVRRLQAQRFVERADKAKGPEAVDLYRSGGLAYLA